MNSLTLHPLQTTSDTKIVKIPGSKSDTNRALVIAALTQGESVLQGISESDDSSLLMQSLEKLGVTFDQVIDHDGTGIALKVQGNGGKFEPFFGELTCGIAGTTGRFLAAVCALVPGEFVLTGEGKMLERPMRELLEGLRGLGVQFEYLGKEGCLPVKFQNKSIPLGGKVQMPGNISSQFFTALLLITPVLSQGLEIEVLGEQVSKSYIDMTLGIMRDFGVEVNNQNYQKYFVSSGQNYIAKEYQIEGDASGCSYFWSIAAITGQRVRVTNINPASVQGDVGFAHILEQMGCEVVKNEIERWIEVQGPTDLTNLRAVEVDMENMPDTAQTLAVVAAFTQGKTRINGLSTLKNKETDRLLATQNELEKMGIHVQTGQDWIEIMGGQPHKATIETYHDHRMAMSFAVAGSRISNMVIKNSQVVSKSFPNFWQKLKLIGVDIQE